MNKHQAKIYNYLLESIIKGELAVKERIPTEIELSKKFKTNRMNAHLAIKKLDQFGLLQRNKRQGTFVQKRPGTKMTGELKSINTRRVCVLNHTFSEYQDIHWNVRITNSFEQVLKKNRSEMVYKNIAELHSYEAFRDYIRGIVEEGYNALVMIGDYITDDIISSHPEVLFEFHNNVFMFNRGMPVMANWPYAVVSVNLFSEGIIAAEFLLKQRYEEVAYVTLKDSYWVQERLHGLQFGFKREGADNIHPDMTLLSREELPEALHKLVLSGKKCAIVGSNDEYAIDIYKAAKQVNLKPGIDFGLMGFDDNIRYREYNLTTVSPPLEKIGFKLGQLVVNKLDGEEDEIANIRINSKLIIRNTC